MARPHSFSTQFPYLRVATVIAIALASLSSTAAAEEPLERVLQSWVAGAADVEAPSLATARARFGRELSAHQLEAAVFLWAPDSVASLTAKFDWTIEESVLTGIPCDDIERAFIGTVEVRWDTDTQRPESIQFAGASEPIEFATIRRANESEVDHVVFYQEAAESGAEAIVDNVSEVRTASAVIGESVTSIELPASMMNVDEVLDRWAAASAFNGPWEIEIEGFSFDEAFAIETRSYIMMRGDAAGTIEFRTDPMDVEPGTLNEQRLRSDGVPFQVETESSRAIVFTPQFVKIVDIASQSFHQVESVVFADFPWYKHPLQTPNCMTFNLPVATNDLRDQFIWTITRQTHDEIWLQAIPRTEEVARCVSTVNLILDAVHFRPMSVRCIRDGYENIMVVRERSVPEDLTAEIILEGYNNFSEATLPEKGEARGNAAENRSTEQEPSFADCVEMMGSVLSWML